jgi:hypothetical protein
MSAIGVGGLSPAILAGETRLAWYLAMKTL